MTPKRKDMRDLERRLVRLLMFMEDADLGRNADEWVRTVEAALDVVMDVADELAARDEALKDLS